MRWICRKAVWREGDQTDHPGGLIQAWWKIGGRPSRPGIAIAPRATAIRSQGAPNSPPARQGSRRWRLWESDCRAVDNIEQLPCPPEPYQIGNGLQARVSLAGVADVDHDELSQPDARVSITDRPIAALACAVGPSAPPPKAQRGSLRHSPMSLLRILGDDHPGERRTLTESAHQATPLPVLTSDMPCPYT
jgi:hypothetical protein